MMNQHNHQKFSQTGITLQWWDGVNATVDAIEEIIISCLGAVGQEKMVTRE